MQTEKKTIMILCTVPDERAETVLEKAHALGYRTVFCAEQDHEQTRKASDAYYTVDWNDTAELFRIAGEEHICGVTGLCDSAMVPAARVSEHMGLEGNTPESMRRLVSKEEFRILQRDAGVFCPSSAVAETAEELRAKCASLRFPVIIKPMLCSSSHGMTVLQEIDGIYEAFHEAEAYSRNGAVCAEEYIRNDSLRIIEADVFLYEDDILWDGIRYCYRLENAPLRPAYDVYPVEMSEEEWDEFTRTVRSVLKASGASTGEYNVEGFFTVEGRFFIVEVNPRQAGCYNPQDIELYCGVDLTRLLISTAMGDRSYYEELRHFRRTRNNILSYSVFSLRPGILDHIHIDGSIRPNLVAFRYLHGQKEGDHVEDIVNAVRPIAKTVFRFDNGDDLEIVRRKITELVYPVMIY